MDYALWGQRELEECVSKISVAFLEENICELNLNDALNQNRLGDELIDGFLAQLKALSQETSLKVLIITGCDDVFCGGGSLETLRKLSEKAREPIFFEIADQMLGFPVPIVSAARGHAVGGGLLFAIYADLSVACETSRYSVNFTDMGFTPGMGTTTVLPALVGYPFAAEMILTAKFYKGRELEGRGLFNYIVPADRVMPVALDMARRMAEKPRHVLEMLKETLVLPRRQALHLARSHEQLMHQVCFSRPEGRSYIEESYIR